MQQCIHIVVDNSNSQDEADAQEKHYSILMTFCKLILMNPARHITFSVFQYMMGSYQRSVSTGKHHKLQP